MEAPALHLPVVNVGNRQRGRLHADNVQFVPHDERLIMEAVRRAVYDDAYRARVARCESPYGDGRAAARISETLASIPIDDRLLIKDITY
jgi:GDP/UDP-N,N'-diacetylbacillosamine 2-epimerase (hydrolysing)